MSGGSVSQRIRSALISMTVCGCHRDKEAPPTLTRDNRPLQRNSTLKDNFDVIISADEKLRSLGGKSHHQPVPKSSTYCGPQNPAAPEPPAPAPASRTAAPDVAPPPIPSPASQDKPDASPAQPAAPPPADPPPPLYPKPQVLLNQMAERRIQRGQRDERRNDETPAKRRSRSAGPQNRRRVRSSMHETPSAKMQQSKPSSNGRHSMYAEHMSDDDVMISGSDSADSDEMMQQWTKNPLMVKKSRKADRNSKTDQRKSFQNTENGLEHASRQRPLSQQRANSKDLFIYPRRSDSSPSSSHKSKFQRMEENRRKRIDMAITSDEECSPELRISRLRQRAMLSSKIFNDDMNPQILNPGRDDNYYYQDNGYSARDMSDQHRLSQYEDIRNSKYDENSNLGNMNENLYNEYARQKEVKQTKLPNILPEYLPEAPSGKQQNLQMRSSDAYNRNKTEPQKTPVNIPVKGNTNVKPQVAGKSTSQTRVKLSSESPKLRSFNEVKASQPAPLKQAVEKFELNPRSPNSSSEDSLDELIESNIQYLESEIESGKLKRQSGSFSNVAPVKSVQGSYISPSPVKTVTQIVREPVKPNVTHRSEIRSRLQIPVDYNKEQNVVITDTVPKYSQQPYHMNNMNKAHSVASSSVEDVTDNRNIGVYGSATYSPYMQRRNVDHNIDDMSKSDSQLNTVDTRFVTPQKYFAQERGYVPYPVLNQQTGNITYVQPGNDEQQQHLSGNRSSSLPSAMDTGMFSDVDYDIEVSDRIKKWEKKMIPGQQEEPRKILNTIQEYETMSDSNQTEQGVRDTPVEIRRELRQLVSPTDNTGVGKLSICLTKSSSSIADSKPSDRPYYQPKVVSSETNLHRIFRVVQEPKPSVGRPAELQQETVVVARPRKSSADYPRSYTQGMNTLSESEMGPNYQQPWPPMVDSDSGIRKSWRMSRYEDELNELKEIVSDNFRDLKKRFDSDVSETDTRRGSSPVPVVAQKSRAVSNVPVTLNIQAVTPTGNRSPVVVRRSAPVQTQQPEFATHYSQQHIQPRVPPKPATPPVSPAAAPPPVMSKPEKKVPVYKSIPIETKSKAVPAAEPPPDVWSPNMESRKGLVSIERVKARTLQTIPFSEDPVWKEIEGLTQFDKDAQMDGKVNFEEIDALLKLATGSAENKSLKTSNLNSDTAMSSNFNQSVYDPQALNGPIDRQRKLSDSIITMSSAKKPSFNPPSILPLKLSVGHDKQPIVGHSSQSSASALDEVLEDIRASLQKKPLSPKLLKNIDMSDSNSSTNVQSPLAKPSKPFVFPKVEKKVTTQIQPQVQSTSQVALSSGYDNWQLGQLAQSAASSQPPAPVKPVVSSQSTTNAPPVHLTKPAPTGQSNVPESVAKQIANVPYIDPEFTQFPYIINGNYHLDPTLLSEKLKSTGLVNDSSDEKSRKLAMNPFLQNQSSSQALLTSHATQAAAPLHQTTSTATQGKVKQLDKSVDDLKSLAQEVEDKLSRIKSRIVTADEGKLDTILLALRKFAPITEQKFFNVKFTPNYESEKMRRDKLENALYELDKMYASLELDEKNLLDRASRIEETTRSTDRPQVKQNKVSSKTLTITPAYDSGSVSDTVDSRPYRKSHIEEIERQTQNEFEDITKSFTVLLDEVTRQCRTVAQGSSKYDNTDIPSYRPVQTVQYSNQPPVDMITQERPQLTYETQSQRAVQESYTDAIKELESVATGSFGIPSKKQTTVYLNLDPTQTKGEKTNQIIQTVEKVPASRSLDIKLQSKPVPKHRSQSNFTVTPTQFISMATEFKPSVATSARRETSSSDMEDNTNTRLVPCQAEPKSGGKTRSARFRRKANIEHRKSMPALRTVETQTVETQTEPVAAEVQTEEAARKSSIPDISSDSSPDTRGFPVKRKLSTGIAKIVDMFDSSEDERGRDDRKRDSCLRHSLSAPDIVALFDVKDTKSVKVDKATAKSMIKSVTPRSVKHRSEAKSRFRSLQKDDVSLKKLEMSNLPQMIASVTSEEGVESPTTKPPVYPVWKYPGQTETPSPKKNEKRQAFAFDKDLLRMQSDNERERFKPSDVAAAMVDTSVVRRRTRSVGSEQENEERPKSFHELFETFEQNPQRLEKFRESALRKCASEDSVYTDLILHKMFHSDSDVSQDPNLKRSRSGSESGLKLKLEMRVQKV